MIEISFALIVSAFIAGLLMFLAPCTLPLVPAYLAFISGVKRDELENFESLKHAQKLIILNGFFFTLGFTFVFIAFGMLAGFFGSQIGAFRGLLSQIGGAFIIVFGLLMLGILRIPVLQKTVTVKTPEVFKPGNPQSAFIIGATFALGWTPCVGPVLATVLLLASTSTTVWSGGFLLFVFSLGLSIPFMMTAFLYARATKFIKKIQTISNSISVIGGVFLIFIGILLLTEHFGLMVEYGYRVFNSIGFERLFDYL